VRVTMNVLSGIDDPSTATVRVIVVPPGSQFG
jgi:hypothetical protein